MTTLWLSPPPRFPGSPRGRARLADLCAAEWIKLWSLRSTPVALSLGVALALYLAGASSVHGAVPGAPHAVPRTAFYGPSWLLVMIGGGIAGAQSIVGEHASGLIRVTLAAVPDRRRFALAKAVVVASVMAATALVLAGGGRPAVPADGAGERDDRPRHGDGRNAHVGLDGAGRHLRAHCPLESAPGDRRRLGLAGRVAAAQHGGGFGHRGAPRRVSTSGRGSSRRLGSPTDREPQLTWNQLQPLVEPQPSQT